MTERETVISVTADTTQEAAQTCVMDERTEALVRDMLGLIADRWSLRVIETLADGEMRFTRLRERLDGISQKMLTQTLRQLERDGLVTRHVYAEVPPRVDYRLTPLGEGLDEALCGLWMWAQTNLDAVNAARCSFDGQHGHPPAREE